MTRFLIGAALAVGAATMTGPAAAQQQQPQQAQIKLNLTPAGQAIAKKYIGTPDPQAKAMLERGADLARRQKAVVAAPKFDLNQFAALLRQREALQIQMMKLGNARLLKMLGELSEADRTAFVRGMANPTMVPAPAAK